MSLQALGSTLDTSSTSDSSSLQNVTIDIPSISEVRPLTNTSIFIPTLASIVASRVWGKKTRAGKGKSKLSYQTKGKRSEPMPCEFRSNDAAKLRAVYDISKTLNPNS